MEGHLHRVPITNDCEIQSTVFGPESFTPDNKPLVGPDPSLNGFFHACGFSSSGMMLGGGTGNQIAIWLDEGCPTLDMFGMDISRFTPSSVINDKFVRDKVSEGYAKKYAVTFPFDEPLAGRNFKKSGLHD
jgi:sarcosine dehydrogenase